MRGIGDGMSKVAIIESKKSRNDYVDLFDNEFKFDLFQLASDSSLTKVLKKDVDIDIDIEAYDWVILVGSEPFKYYTKITSITAYTGLLVNEKFLPTINPAMIRFKPEAERPWLESKAKIINYIKGNTEINVINEENFPGIEDEQEAIDYIQAAIDYPLPYIALDSETSNLYCRNGYIIGLSLSYKPDSGCYINADCMVEEVEEKLQELFNKKEVVFHNAKFDLAFFEYHFNFEFPKFHDTMLMHYNLDETQGTHGLKELALKYTKYGDYEKPLNEWKDNYCKTHGVKKADFTYDLIPFDIMKTYAAIDTCVTLALYEKFKVALKKNPKLQSVYDTILIPGCRFLTDIQENGVPFDKARLLFGQEKMGIEVQEAVDALYDFPEIQDMEKAEDKPFNPNSTVQLRKLLFDYIGLKPTGKLTGKGAHSTDAEVLGKLAELHAVPNHILKVRQSGKIKNTYLDKIIPQLDKDSRLRTNFNLSSTTSGRLSSSGKLNMQQLPRDNPTVKGCIKAATGHQIISMDLTTAEVYVAAVLSDDLELQEVFRSGGNFHSTIAQRVFSLNCPVEDIEFEFKTERQAAKAVTFGIMYGAGSSKISEQVTKDGGSMSPKQAQGVINEYFGAFWKLKEWLNEAKEVIEHQAFIYSPFGRKRRLPNVRSDNKGIRGHEVRSGINFIVQSASSDINLLGAIDMHQYIKSTGMKARIFALVHDSILAEVPNEEIDHYKEKLQEFIQLDRGVMIPGCPVGCDFEVGDDYSFGKFVKKYDSELQTLGID